jgi:hypothetical protein
MDAARDSGIAASEIMNIGPLWGQHLGAQAIVGIIPRLATLHALT